MTRNVNQAVLRVTAAAIKERPGSPKTIQSTIATRHPAGGGTPVRRGEVASPVGAGSTITVNFYDATTGQVATEGDEYNVTVYCDISNGSAMNAASVLLSVGDPVTVYQHPYWTGTATEMRWYLVGGLDTTTTRCVCTEAT